jgi:hypothetical protein
MKTVFAFLTMLVAVSCAANGGHVPALPGQGILEIGFVLDHPAAFHQKHITVTGRAHLNPLYSYIELTEHKVAGDAFAPSDGSIDLFIEPGYRKSLNFIKGGECVVATGTFDDYALTRKIYLGGGASKIGAIAVESLRLCKKRYGNGHTAG